MTTQSPIPENINNIEPVLESGKMVTNIANDLGNYLLHNPSHFEQFLQLQIVDGSSLLQHYVSSLVSVESPLVLLRTCEVSTKLRSVTQYPLHG